MPYGPLTCWQWSWCWSWGPSWPFFLTSLTKGSVRLLLWPPLRGLWPRGWFSSWAMRTCCTVLLLTLTSTPMSVRQIANSVVSGFHLFCCYLQLRCFCCHSVQIGSEIFSSKIFEALGAKIQTLWSAKVRRQICPLTLYSVFWSGLMNRILGRRWTSG